MFYHIMTRSTLIHGSCDVHHGALRAKPASARAARAAAGGRYAPAEATPRLPGGGGAVAA